MLPSQVDVDSRKVVELYVLVKATILQWTGSEEVDMYQILEGAGEMKSRV